jgi:hypothetical protein
VTGRQLTTPAAFPVPLYPTADEPRDARARADALALLRAEIG